MMNGGMAPQGAQPAAAPAAGAPDMGMEPNAAPSEAQLTQQIEEGANIAMQGGMMAIEAAQQSEMAPETAVAKIEEGVSLIAEGKEEISGQNAAAAPGLTGASNNPPSNDDSGAGTAEA